MKTAVFSIICLLALVSCKTKKHTRADSASCEKFRTGTFNCYSETEKAYYKVYRNDTMQKEIATDIDLVIKPQRIKWVSPCVYELSMDEKDQDEIDKMIGTITVTIYKIKGDTCYYRTAVANPEFPEMRGYFVKIRD